MKDEPQAETHPAEGKGARFQTASARASAPSNGSACARTPRRGAVPRSQWPDAVRGYVALRGIFIGGCVARGVSYGRKRGSTAHGHTSGSMTGWMCLNKAEYLDDVVLLRHELAHLITGEGHTPTFYAKVRQLNGGVLPDQDARHKARKNLASFMRKLTKAGPTAETERYFELRDAFYAIDRPYGEELDQARHGGLPRRLVDAKWLNSWRVAKKAWHDEAERLLLGKREAA